MVYSRYAVCLCEISDSIKYFFIRRPEKLHSVIVDSMIKVRKPSGCPCTSFTVQIRKYAVGVNYVKLR